jgi:hypothetical protein
MKLTNDMRTEIIIRAVNGTLKSRKSAIKAESNALAILVYDQLYPTDVQHQMSKLPDYFFKQTSTVYAQMTTSERSHDLVALVLDSSRKISAVDNEWKRPKWNCMGVDNAITARIEKLVSKRKKLNQDSDNLREKLRVMLKGITTMKKLAEEWPWGEAYYKDQLPVQPTENLPAVRGEDVTTMMLELGEDTE